MSEQVSTDEDTQTGAPPAPIRMAFAGQVTHLPGTIILRITIPNEAPVKPSSLEVMREAYRPFGWLVEMEVVGQ